MTLIQMQAVIEAPYYEGEFSCPWAIVEFEPYSLMRLHGEMTYPEIGLVFAQLAKHNRIELIGDIQTILKQLVAAKNLISPGGIQIISDSHETIFPSCCCGLETWREWIDFLKTGQTPWLGHDPSPFVENRGDIVRIWSDGGMETVSDAFYIDVSRDRFAKALILLEQDLQAFLPLIGSWAREVGCTESTKLSQKFDQGFNVKMAF